MTNQAALHACGLNAEEAKRHFREAVSSGEEAVTIPAAEALKWCEMEVRRCVAFFLLTINRFTVDRGVLQRRRCSMCRAIDLLIVVKMAGPRSKSLHDEELWLSIVSLYVVVLLDVHTALPDYSTLKLLS